MAFKPTFNSPSSCYPLGDNSTEYFSGQPEGVMSNSRKVFLKSSSSASLETASEILKNRQNGGSKRKLIKKMEHSQIKPHSVEIYELNQREFFSREDLRYIFLEGASPSSEPEGPSDTDSEYKDECCAYQEVDLGYEAVYHIPDLNLAVETEFSLYSSGPRLDEHTKSISGTETDHSAATFPPESTPFFTAENPGHPSVDQPGQQPKFYAAPAQIPGLIPEPVYSFPQERPLYRSHGGNEFFLSYSSQQVDSRSKILEDLSHEIATVGERIEAIQIIISEVSYLTSKLRDSELSGKLIEKEHLELISNLASRVQSLKLDLLSIRLDLAGIRNQIPK